MKTLLIGIGLALLMVWQAPAQVTLSPASATETAAGVSRTKYVTPAGLSASGIAGGPTNGITSAAATNLFNNNIVPVNAYAVSLSNSTYFRFYGGTSVLSSASSVASGMVRAGVTNTSDTTNALVSLAYGGLHMSPQVYGAFGGNANWQGGLIWHTNGWTGTVTAFNVDDAIAAIRLVYNWGGSVGENVMHFRNAWSMRMEPGYANGLRNGYTYFSFGNEDANTRMQLNHCTAPLAEQENYGYSLPWIWQVAGMMGGDRYYGQPGIQGIFAGTNSLDFDNIANRYGLGELGFFSRTAAADATVAGTFGLSKPSYGVEVGRMLIDGWRWRGRELHQHDVGDTSTTNLLLDFSKFAQTFDLTTAPSQTNVFSLTNITYWTTNNYPVQTLRSYEERKYLIRSGALDRYIIWPTNFLVGGESGSDVLPATLPAQKFLKLTVETWGLGTSNVTVSYITGPDTSFTYDTDASAFFTSASLSTTLDKGAIDYLCKAMKGADVWTNWPALWPMRGGNATSHSKNLKGASYTITWVGTPTQDANGVTGNGSTMYGQTGFTPSTALGAQGLTNCSIFVYNRTTLPTDSGRLIGATGTSGGRFALARSGATLGYDGPMNGNGLTAGPSVASDFRGFLGMGRDISNNADYWMITPGAVTPLSSPVSVVTADELYLLARNAGGVFDFSSANLAAAGVGWGMTSNKWVSFRSIINQYETILGLNVP